MQKIIIQIIGITSISIILGFGRYFVLDEHYNLVKEKRILNSLESGNSDSLTDCSIPEQLSEPMFIDAEFAFCLYEAGNVIFVDARDPEEFEQLHIKNSINIPYDYFEDFMHQIDSINKEIILVTYCSGGDCSLSIDLADHLFFEADFYKVLVFEGGFPLWQGKGFPIN